MSQNLRKGKVSTAGPRVSVVIPSYNSQGTIVRALRSVVAQTLRPTEVIVVDDGSADDSVSVVKQFSRWFESESFKLVELGSNYGPGYARNVGWDRASGDFIAFLDADDAWHRCKLQIQATYMLKHNELALTGHRCLCLSQQATPPALAENWQVKPILARQLMLSYQVLTPSVIVKRQIPHRFNPTKRYSEDRLLWLQIVLDGHKAARLELPLAYLYKAPYGEGGLSSQLWKMEKGELDVYTELRRTGCLNRVEETVLKAFSLSKYLRRVFLPWRTSHVA